MRKRFERVKTVAATNQVHVNTVYRWLRSGHVEAKRLGSASGGWLVRVDEEGHPVTVEHTTPSDPRE